MPRNFFFFECWQVLDQFRKIDPNDQQELKRVSGIIWKKYLSTRSETEVNIGEEEKKMAENKDLTPFKYEEVQKSLFKTLKLDSFIQFLKSQEYANYFIEHVPTDIAPLIINEFKEILSKLQQPRYQVIKTFFIVLFKTLNMEKNEIGLSNLVSSITPVIFQTTPTEEMDYKAKTLITKFFITNVLKIFDIDENFLKENMENNTNGENSNIIIKVPLKKSKNKKDKDKNKGHTDDVDEKKWK